MKVCVYGSREDEMGYYENREREFNFQLTFTEKMLTPDTVELAKGCTAIVIVTACRIDANMAALLKEAGVKYIASRAAGTDHMDLDAIAANGLKAASVPFYSPSAIAEHTMLLTLALLRNLKREMMHVQRSCFTLDNIRGRELGNMTVGVIGTGRIGERTIQLLSGFGCRILAYDIYEKESVKKLACYAPLDELYAQSDILILHCPLTKENYHMINYESLVQLKDGVLIVNTARGGLIDHRALLDALNGGKVAGFAFDVYENESAFMRKDLEGAEVDDPIFNALIAKAKVLFTSHMSFYTDTAIENMIQTTLENLREYSLTGSCKNELTR